MPAAVASQAANLPFQPERLEAFLRDRIPGLAGAMTIERIAGGQSNPTYFVDFANRRLVLRKRPPGQLLRSAHAVDREYRVMQALAATDVPVPPLLLFHGEDDVVGTPFYLMERVEGRVFRDCMLPDIAAADRQAMYLEVADVMARLHAVDPETVGLGDYGKPGGYFDRQLARWSGQWWDSPSRPDFPDIDDLISWLQAHMPADDGRVAIVHGDFKLGNMIFHPSEPRLMAVLDWELATIGDPLADLAFSALPWHRGASGRAVLDGIGAESGIPSEADYVRAYCRRTGRDGIVGWNFYLAFAMFRLAAIMQGVYRRVLDGTVASNFAAVNQAPDLAERALAALNDQRLREI
jgi:aminoglycoside phosphotransferase (APT) family kinase protein